MRARPSYAVVAGMLVTCWLACSDDGLQVVDGESPAMINDLTITGVTRTTFTLAWTATGDDGRTGRATSYVLRHSGGPIDASNFGAATLAPGVPAPQTAGAAEAFTVAGLDSLQDNYFAIRAVDDAGHHSPISNVAAWYHPPEDTTITDYRYTIVHSYPHDTGAFTEGLIWDDSALVEGTGYYGGPSTLRRVDLTTGQVIQSREAALKPDPPYFVFGEGITRVGDRIVELTWTEHLAFVYDATTFDSIGVYQYPTQGWGLTHDDTRFIMSDGTSTLYFRDFNTFDEIGRVTVHDENGPVTNLNELELIDGRVWANVYQTTRIVMIDPATGRVRGRVDLAGILASPPDVANGIAFDAAGGRIFVTGKRWPTLFQIGLVTPPAKP